jgi:hypothetical protein
MSWNRHLRTLLLTFAGTTLALVLFVLAMNPYGNLPGTVLREHVMTDINQRYQYPSVVRSGRYDSLIIGTSTSRLLDPRPFERMLGGRFANVAMNAGTAWEQTELTKLFLRHQASPHALVVGIDWVWCAANADRERITFRGFPEWMYDDDPWNDLSYMLNTRALEIAGRRAAVALGLGKPRLPPDGWEIFTPAEREFDLERVRVKIYGDGPRVLPAPKAPPDTASPAERAAWRYPALDWLARLIDDGNWKRVLLVYPPVHVVAQPRPGTREALAEAECKARIASIAAVRQVPVIDFRLASDVTTRDENFWDPLHYRVAIAERIAAGIAEALATGRDDPKGFWRVVKASSTKASD